MAWPTGHSSEFWLSGMVGIVLLVLVGCSRCTRLCWVAKHANVLTYETDELPNPRPTHPKKNQVESGIGGHLFPTASSVPVGWDRFGTGNRLEDTQPNRNSPAKALLVVHAFHGSGPRFLMYSSISLRYKIFYCCRSPISVNLLDLDRVRRTCVYGVADMRFPVSLPLTGVDWMGFCGSPVPPVVHRLLAAVTLECR